jgi:nucleotide-binding universal stress UspA family protein
MSTRDGHIVVGIDGSAPSIEAVRWAAAQAALWGRDLRLVHAYSSYAAVVPFGGAAYGWSEATVREQAEAIVADAVARARAADADIKVTGHAMYGPPAQVLIDLSGTAGLVVVGDRGHGGFASLMLGSVANALVAHAACPVAVVRQPAGGDGIVVGVDGSPAADAALGYAFEEAGRRGAALLVVHSWEPPAPPWQGDTAPLHHDTAQLTTAHTRQVDDWVRPWREKFPGVAVEIRLTGQRPAAALIAASASAALVVVGSRGRGGFTGLLLGSVSQQLIHHAASPVVVTRAPAV